MRSCSAVIDISSSLNVFSQTYSWGPARSRMGFVVQGEELVHGDMCIFLCGAERGMSQHFLDRPQVCSLVEEVCSKRMPQRMWADRASGEGPRIPRHNSGDTA